MNWGDVPELLVRRLMLLQALDANASLRGLLNEERERRRVAVDALQGAH
jgi:hypothetical protein